jgi:phage antirepressor YoqD-like protein
MNETQLKPFIYEGNQITFETGNEVMVNATQMAKQFGKLPNDWLRLPGTQEFINELSIARKSRNCDYQAVITRAGAPETGGGTWLHEDAAIEFARWLSPKFAIWCNDRIKELLTTGVATVADDDAAILHAMQVLQKRVEDREIELKEAKSNLRFAEGQIEEQQKQIKELAPKADYTDKVLQSKTTLTFSQVALDLGLRSIHVLTRFLSSRGVIYRQSGQWLVASKFREGGYFETRTHLINHDDKRVETKIYTVVTEKGREWLHTIIEANRAKGFAIN